MRTASKLLLAAALVSAAIACAPSKEPSAGGSDKIIGGFTAPEGAFPGTAALFYSRGDDDDDNVVANTDAGAPVTPVDNTYQGCGGSLIAPDWVMTAGHCVEPDLANGSVAKVVLGRQDLTKTSVGEERKVDRVIRHEGFDDNTLDNDIALLHLATPSTTPVGRLITPDQVSKLIDGAAATVVGWGSIAEDGKSSDQLLEVTVPIMSNAQCATYPQYAGVTPNEICAAFTSGGFDSCQGDSGGPIYISVDGAPVQFGTVSWGIGCAEANAPGVYLRVGNYLGWIFDKTNGAAGTQAPPPATDGGTPVPPPPPATDGGTPVPPPPPATDGGTPASPPATP